MKELTQPHVLIQGQISFENKYGFLNSNQNAMRRFHLYMTLLYLAIVFAWYWQMNTWKESVVSIHKYLLVLVVITLISCFFKFVEYEHYNNQGHRLKWLLFVNVILEASKNTFARALVLLISLGYGIVMNVLSSYLTKIGLLLFFYFISNAFSIALFYINE